MPRDASLSDFFSLTLLTSFGRLIWNVAANIVSLLSWVRYWGLSRRGIDLFWSRHGIVVSFWLHCMLHDARYFFSVCSAVLLVVCEQVTLVVISDTDFTTRRGRIRATRWAHTIHTFQISHDFILPYFSGSVWVRIVIWTLWPCHAWVILVSCTPVLFSEPRLKHWVRLHELLLTLELGYAVLERLYCLLTLINLFLVVSLARVE